ncbi:MAG: putative addiction module antidote protein [Desulfofustis sp. PB-SRB1]|jgi:probable addiction module antidote protein|nr:putative addiction module antidote protein [Desulfofustis sp. PB-SRB1]MBM1002474.1 putative addiction module antidote protein [Desulfofustis sp. PB-SRB1]HBH29802.1 putative addiction module antidote protein [Desulfofustis sp.]HBH32514.1 putative addiction module antidote protein [Desulfofustis sp.]
MAKHTTLDELEGTYFQDHSEEVDSYIKLIFEDYAKDGDTGALLSSLRVLSRVKGVSKIAQEAGLSRMGVQKALSEDGNPKLASINAIVHAMGYRLSLEKLNV